MISRPVAQVQKCVRHTGARTIFNKASAMPQVTVDEEFPTVPKTHPQPVKVGKITSSVTSSGLKIASDNSEPLVATLGVEIAAGTRTENDTSAGLSQLAAKLAFRATEARSDLRLYRDIEAIGGVVHKSAGRDFVRYNISVLPHQLDAAAEILAETTLAPRFANWDISIQKDQLKIEHELLVQCSERTVYEGVHAAAFYDDVGLGRPIFTTENLASLDDESLKQFHQQYVNTNEFALVGTGIEHDVLNEVATNYFGSIKASSTPTTKSPAKYVGGEYRVKKAARNTYVALGFQTAGKKASEYGASHVLKAILSARLNNKKATGFLASYDDVGLVGFSGYAAPADAGALVDSFITVIKDVAAKPPTAEELASAKTVAALEAATVLGSRQGRTALLGAVALTQSTPASPLAIVDGVSAKAVQELAQKALASRPSLASVGVLSSVPRVDEVISKLK